METNDTFKISMIPHKHTEYFSSYGFRCPKSLNPFLNLDLFHMSMPTFPPHPHAGFSAVTYLFPSSMGQFQNRDSKWDKSLIEPGGLHWTQAGQGMFHEEIPSLPGIDCFGLQMFVKLPKQFELLEGKAFHLSPKEIPQYKENGMNAKIVLGSLGGITNTIEGLQPTFQFLDVQLDPNTNIKLELKPTDIHLIVVISGKILSDSGESISPNEILIIKNQNGDLQLKTFEESCNFLFLSSPKLLEDYIWNGPLCMSDANILNDTISKLRSGELGNLSASF